MDKIKKLGLIYLLVGVIVLLYYLCMFALTKSENMIGFLIGSGIVYLIVGIYFWKKGVFTSFIQE
jgi:hypothetical protein